jgi:hypothetical protein
VHSGQGGGVLLPRTPTTSGMALQCPGWPHRTGGDGGDTPYWFDITVLSWANVEHASVPFSRAPPSSFEGAALGPYESE